MSKPQEKAIQRMIKFGRADHMAALLNHGEVYLNTVGWFRQADANAERYDNMEGASEIDQVTWIKLQDEEGNVFEFSRPEDPRHTPKHGRLRSAHVLTHSDGFKGNIFSCTGIEVGEGSKFKRLDSRFGQFGDAAILIENPNQFLNRVEEALRSLGLEYLLSPVTYYDPNSFVGKLGPFMKKDMHAYQHEVRIWVKSDADEPIRLQVGSLRDIAVGFKLDGILESV